MLKNLSHVALFSLVFTAAASLGWAQDAESFDGSWRWIIENSEAKEPIYFTLNKHENGLRGQRFPAPEKFLKTILRARSEGLELRGQIVYLDTKAGSPWSNEAKAPSALWEFKLDGNKLSGRWQQILVNFDAEDPDKLVESRTWVGRELTRVPRFGGYKVFNHQEPLEVPSGDDLSGVPAAAFTGLFVSDDGSQTKLTTDGQNLRMTLGNHSYTLRIRGRELIGQADKVPVSLAIELTAKNKTLEGRVEWKDYDETYDTVVQSGWSAVRLERLSPKAKDSEPSKDQQDPENKQPEEPKSEVEPLLFGFKAGQETDDSAPKVEEGKARKVSGTWKIAKGRYLRLRQRGTAVTGSLNWDGKKYQLRGTVFGDTLLASWTILEPETVELDLKMSVPRKTTVMLKLQWVSKKPGGDIVESGWTQLKAKKLRRLG